MEKPAGKTEIPSLTPLRGIAAFGVFVLHVGTFLPSFAGWMHATGLEGGVERFYIAVDLFFMLSGYLLYLLYVTKFRVLKRGVVTGFLWKRWFRIYPLLFIASTVNLALEWNYRPEERIRWLYDISLLNSINRYFPALHAYSWSLSAEWFAYLAAPFLFFALGRFPRRGWLVVLTGSLALLVFLMLTYWINLDRITPVRGILGFSIGAALAASGVQVARRWANGVFLLFLTAFLGSIFVIPRTPFSEILNYLLLAGVLVAGPGVTGRVDTVLNRGPIHWFGTVSYSFYLWQKPVFLSFVLLCGAGWISPGRTLGMDFVWLACLFLACVLISAVSYRWIEIFFRDLLIRKFMKREKEVPVPDPPPSPEPGLLRPGFESRGPAGTESS